MVVTDKTELSTTIRTAVLRLGHDALLRSQASARRLHQRCALAGNAALHWRSGKHAALPRDVRRINVWQSSQRTDRPRPSKPGGLPVVEPSQMWAGPAAWVATAAARRLRNCASSASSAQNSEQKCCPADVRQTST